MVRADDVNIMGGRVHAVKKNTAALAVTSKENGLKVNVGKTKYMVTCRDWNAGQSQNMRIENRSFERVESSNIWEQP